MGLEGSLGGHKMEPNAQIKQEGGRFNFSTAEKFNSLIPVFMFV